MEFRHRGNRRVTNQPDRGAGSAVWNNSVSKSVCRSTLPHGKLLWKFDSGIKGTQPDRGLAYWSDGKESRIVVAVMNFVYALDATTGTPISTFGNDGPHRSARRPAARAVRPVDLWDQSGRDLQRPDDRRRARAGELFRHLRAMCEPTTCAAESFVWSFHTIPHPGEFGYDTWPRDAWKTSGAANNWTGMTVDTQRGIVYVPTGSAAFDFYGADRVGDDLFANSLIALKADTGERIWHFQAVKHDLWDRDFPAPPVLLTLTRRRQEVDESRRPASRASYFSLTARTASRCSRSNAATIPRATFLAKSLFAISACLPSPCRLRDNA